MCVCMREYTYVHAYSCACIYKWIPIINIRNPKEKKVSCRENYV